MIPRAAILRTLEIALADLRRGDTEAARALLEAHARAVAAAKAPDGCWAATSPRRDS